MPFRSKKPCCVGDCKKLTSGRYCEDHTVSKHVARPYDDRRGSSSERGYDSAWRKLRLVALRRDNFLCLHCLKEGRPFPATDVDHIIPIAEDPDKRLDLDNLQSLCKRHHDIKTLSDNNGWGRRPTTA